MSPALFDNKAAAESKCAYAAPKEVFLMEFFGSPEFIGGICVSALCITSIILLKRHLK